MTEALKVYSVVIAWDDSDFDQGDWGCYVRAPNHGEAETLGRLAMRLEYIANLPEGDDPEEMAKIYEGPDGFGHRIVSCTEGAAWLSKELEEALRNLCDDMKRLGLDGYYDEKRNEGIFGAYDDARRVLAEIDAIDGPDVIYEGAAKSAGWEQGGDGPIWWHSSHGSWKNAVSWGRTYATAREVIESADYPEYQGREDER